MMMTVAPSSLALVSLFGFYCEVGVAGVAGGVREGRDMWPKNSGGMKKIATVLLPMLLSTHPKS